MQVGLDAIRNVDADVRHVVLGLRVEDDLAGARRAAQARREVRHVADRRVLPALLEADHAERRLALRDADAEADLVAELCPGLRDRGERFRQGERHEVVWTAQVVPDEAVCIA